MLAEFFADFTGIGTNWTSCTPRNWKDTKIQVIFTNDYPSATLQSINYEFTGAQATKINNFITTFGVNQGIPYQITVNGQQVFFGVIDTANESSMFQCDNVKCPLKKIGSIDWLMDSAEATTFRAIWDATQPANAFPTISASNPGYKPMPGYPIMGPPPGDPNYQPAIFYYQKFPYCTTFREWETGIIYMMEELSLAQHVYTSLVNTYNAISNTIGSIADATFIEAAAMVVSDAFQLVYDIFLVNALAGLTETLINQTVGVTKYKYGMLVSDLMNAGVYYINNILGTPTSASAQMKFKSTIFDGTGYGGIYKNTCIIPKKNLKVVLGKNLIPSMFGGNLDFSGAGWGQLTEGNEAFAGTIGPPYGYYDGNYKKLINDIKAVFNGSVVVFGNTIQLEEKHFWNNIANFQLPNTEVPGPNVNWLDIPDPHSTNFMTEGAFSYIVRFMTDGSDEMTLKNYKGTTAMATIQPARSYNPLYTLAPPSRDIILPFALAKRKEQYNVAEQVINDLLTGIQDIINTLFVDPLNDVINAINAVVSVVGAKITPLNPIKPVSLTLNRIGYMETSNDTFTTQKIVIGDPQGKNVMHIISDFAPAGVPQFFDPGGAWNTVNPANAPPNGNVVGSYPWTQNPMSAAALLGTPKNNQFHGLNLLTRGNQWKVYKNKTFPMCLTEFLQIVNNTNVLKDAKGNYGKFDKILFNIYLNKAENVDYKINVTYDLNLTEILDIDGN